MRTIYLFVVIMLMSLITTSAWGQIKPHVSLLKPGNTLRVGIHNFPPFAFKVKTKDENGKEQMQWRGLEVDALKAMALDLHMKIKYKEYGFQESFNALKNAEVDVIVAGISVTAEREALPYLKFSHPTITSGLGILERAEKKTSIWTQLSTWLALFFKVGGLLLIIIGGLPAIFALITMRYIRIEQNETNASLLAIGVKTILSYKDAFYDRYSHYVGLVTTWGNGTYNPSKLRIRYLCLIFGVVCWLAGILFAAVFTAMLTASLLEEQPHRTPDQLRNLPVATKRGTTSVEVLDSYGARVTETTTIEEAVELLLANKVDAVVFDSVVLSSIAKSDLSGKVLITYEGSSFEVQDYAFGIRADVDYQPNAEVGIRESLREHLNISWLRFKASNGWKKAKRQYLGLQ